MPPIPQGLLPFLRACSVREERFAYLQILEDLRQRILTANRVTNLTRIVSPQAYWGKHVADSLSIGLAYPWIMERPYRLADVGTGAGFPLLPLAWANPSLSAVGIESKQKKAVFVEDTARDLGLKNCSVAARQVRECGNLPDYRGAFDLVVARAVGASDRLIRETRHLLKASDEARLILYKTPEQINSEKIAITKMADKYGLTVEYSSTFQLPGKAGARQFILVRTSIVDYEVLDRFD